MIAYTGKWLLCGMENERFRYVDKIHAARERWVLTLSADLTEVERSEVEGPSEGGESSQQGRKPKRLTSPGNASRFW